MKSTTPIDSWFLFLLAGLAVALGASIAAIVACKDAIGAVFLYGGEWQSALLCQIGMGVASSIACFFAIYKIQESRAKRAVRHDPTCRFILDHISQGIHAYNVLVDGAIKQAAEATTYSQESFDLICDWIQDHRPEIELVCEWFFDDMHDILIRSIRATFFLNVNPRALGVVNNIDHLSRKTAGALERAYSPAHSNAKEVCSLELLFLLKSLVDKYQELLVYIGFEKRIDAYSNFLIGAFLAIIAIVSFLISIYCLM